jgi:hypothetical protein
MPPLVALLLSAVPGAITVGASNLPNKFQRTSQGEGPTHKQLLQASQIAYNVVNADAAGWMSSACIARPVQMRCSCSWLPCPVGPQDDNNLCMSQASWELVATKRSAEPLVLMRLGHAAAAVMQVTRRTCTAGATQEPALTCLHRESTYMGVGACTLCYIVLYRVQVCLRGACGMRCTGIETAWLVSVAVSQVTCPNVPSYVLH